MSEAVLFVDDDEDLCEMMRAILGRLGVSRVVVARSLRDVEAQRAGAIACTVAILDINLGNDQPSGVKVYEWLHREGFTGRTIFLTGHAANDPRVQEAASLTGSVVASKPLSVPELRDLIGGARQAI